MNLTVEQSDIKRIGHTTYQEDNCTIFVCDLTTSNIEEILLRNILRTFGDYSIIDIDDYDENSIEFMTDLPWDIYMKL